MENLSKNIDGIRKMMKALKAEKYAIKNPDLIALDEYVKGLYLKVLCTVVQYENDPTDMQVLFLKRIIIGMNVDNSLEDYMKRALEISDSDIQEFLSMIGDSQIKYYFATDGLILVSMGNDNAQGYEYLAELIELLGINKADLEYICMVVKSILQQQSSYYDQSKELVNERVAHLNFAPYIQNYYAGAVIDTDTEKYYTAPDKTLSEQIEYPKLFKERKVVFESLIIKIGSDKDWKFEGCEEVIFKNCEFTSESCILKMESVGNVIFEGCKFSNFKNHVSYIEGINNLTVENCEFIECGYTDSGDICGGVFCIYNSESVFNELKLVDNKLLNCYIARKPCDGSYYATGVFLGFHTFYRNNKTINSKVQILNNSFVGCKCINNVNYTAAMIGPFSCNNVEKDNNVCTGELTRVFADR